MVYNGKTTDKSSIMDVFCGIKSNKKLVSSGPFLVIEFESGSNGGHGFAARYRFTELEGECIPSDECLCLSIGEMAKRDSVFIR